MNRTIRLAAATLLAAFLAACQTVSSGPDPRTLALITGAGFTPADIAILNRNLGPDDIRTTALYICGEPRCGDFSLVAYGIDPAIGEGSDEVKALGRMSRAQALRAADRIMRSAGLTDLKVVNVETTSAAGLQIITIDLRGVLPIGPVHLRMSGAYGEGPARVVAAAGPRRDLTMRLGGRSMLGL
jgi:hypothetical protein